MKRKNTGFTLIELLVVVLIIGILSAIALPQYEKAVEKAKAAQAFSIIRTFAAAQESYHLANGTYAQTFDELEVDMPWTGNVRWIAGSSPQARSNSDWSLQLFYEGNGQGIAVGRISGPYAGAGFIYLLENVNYDYPTHKILCHENHYETNNSITFSKPNGSYCQKIFSTQEYHLSPLP